MTTTNETSDQYRRESTAANAYTRKVALIAVGLTSVVLGLIFTVWHLPPAFVRWLQAVLGTMTPEAAGNPEVARMAASLLYEASVSIIAMVVVDRLVQRRAKTQLAFLPGAELWVAMTRNTVAAGVAMIFSGGALFATLAYGVIRFIGVVPALKYVPFFSGLSFLVICIGWATLIDLPLVIEDARARPEPSVSLPAPAQARATGQELMERLRQSPVFRRQIHFETVLDDRKFGFRADGRKLLRERFPRIEAILPQIGIKVLSADQAAALAAIAANEKNGISRDMVFIGRAGSGRTTLSNLIALGVALQNEGSVHCVTAQSPSQHVDSEDGEPTMVRHPAVQMRQWLDRAKLRGAITMQTSFRDDGTPLDVSEAPHVIYTDVRMLSQSLLTRVRGDARQLLSRLRYVIIDQPERLSREDLVRLRLAMSRLRMTGEILGTPITFIINLPRLNNAVEVAKYLVNRAEVEAVSFGSWVGRCDLVGWVPPLEVAESNDSMPRFVRSRFIDESTALLTELGFQANQLEKPLRIAVVDSKPLFGPEAREYVRERVRDAIAAETKDGETFEVRAQWRYFTQTELGGEHEQEFDVIVSLGIGRYPRELVASLRPALANDGALILVADSSPDDIDSLERISARGWSPEREDEHRRFPGVLLPDHSDAVLAHELSALFEDFNARPLPRGRLLEVFPGAGVGELLRSWAETQRIREVTTFETLSGNDRWPRTLRCFMRSDAAFTSELYEIPWGCCSRDIYKIYDVTANRAHAAGPFLNDAVDRDRLFIDFYPQTVLRYAPNTLLVRQKRDDAEPSSNDVALAGRYRELGRLEVETLHRDDCIRIDRRALRVRTRLTAERPREDGGKRSVAADHPLHGLVEDGALADSTVRRSLSANSRVAVIGGEWYCRIEETVRDVVRTTDRLVEEPDYSIPVRAVSDDGAALVREFECVGLSLFLHADEKWETDGDPLHSYEAHYALARAAERYLRRDFIHFDTEFRVAVIPHGDRFRILFYRLRSDELGWNHTLASVLEPEDLLAIFDSVHRRLESCDCADGCSTCCGSLGTIPVELLPRHGYTNDDAISRRGAYQLVCGILGRAVDWDRFSHGRVDRFGPVDTVADAQLTRLVAEVIGTAGGNYTDGIWTRLFGGSMRLLGDMIATPQWMSAADKLQHPLFAGYYSPAANRVVVRPHKDLTYLREVIVHEFTHNWQFRGGVFDLDTHYAADEMKQYFDGNLLIEGHAVWCEQLYRAYQKLSASYTPNDGRPWNEYKVGYLLLEAVEKAIGQNGLFLWLCKGEKPQTIRSNDRRLQWPFTTEEALRAFDLARFVRREPFTGFDVSEAASEDAQAVPA